VVVLVEELLATKFEGIMEYFRELPTKVRRGWLFLRPHDVLK
jgi:hypothetical protein